MNQTTRISRRGFLARAALVSTAPYIIPSSVLGENAPSNRIHVGILGAGGQGRSLINYVYRHKDRARVIAVCDVNAENTAMAKSTVDHVNEAEDCAVYRDFREMLARDDLDAVVIATPDHWHALASIAAARAGKHIYGEKPVAYTVAEGRAMVEAVQRYGVIFQHGTQQRSQANFRHACALVRNGRLGNIHTVRVGSPFGKRGGSIEAAPPPEGLDYEFWLGPAPYKPYTPGRCDGRSGEGWYHIRDYSGGWVTAWGSHDVDIAQWGMGADHTSPIEYEGWGAFPTGGVYDTAWRWRVECRYADGVRMIYASEDESPHGIRFEGDEGWLFVNRGVLEAEPVSLLAEKFSPDEEHLGDSTDHMGNFFDCIRTGATPASPIEASHRSTSACHLCNVAMTLGRTVRWDPENERAVDDDEANRMLARAMRQPWHMLT